MRNSVLLYGAWTQYTNQSQFKEFVLVFFSVFTVTQIFQLSIFRYAALDFFKTVNFQYSD